MLLQSFAFQENKSKHTYVKMYVIEAFLYQCLFPEWYIVQAFYNYVYIV